MRGRDCCSVAPETYIKRSGHQSICLSTPLILRPMFTLAPSTSGPGFKWNVRSARAEKLAPDVSLLLPGFRRCRHNTYRDFECMINHTLGHLTQFLPSAVVRRFAHGVVLDHCLELPVLRFGTRAAQPPRRSFAIAELVQELPFQLRLQFVVTAVTQAKDEVDLIGTIQVRPPR